MKGKGYLLLIGFIILLSVAVQGHQLYLTYDGDPLISINIHIDANQEIEEGHRISNYI